MPNKPRTFRQADLERALRAGRRAGLTIHGFRIAVDGTITVLTTPEDTKPLSPNEQWQTERGAWTRRDGAFPHLPTDKEAKPLDAEAGSAPTKAEAHEARRSRRTEAALKALEDVQEQWLRERAAGQPLTKHEVQIGRRTITWPNEETLAGWEAELDRRLLARGIAPPSQKRKRLSARPKRT